VLGAIGQVIKAENKGAGLAMGVFSVLVGPLTYAASFRAHAAWTHADLSDGGRYLPGEYWQVVSDGAGAVSAMVVSVVPALGNAFQSVEDSPLLSQIVASAVSGLVLDLARRMLFKKSLAVA
jgi:hypothetical protein